VVPFYFWVTFGTDFLRRIWNIVVILSILVPRGASAILVPRGASVRSNGSGVLLTGSIRNMFWLTESIRNPFCLTESIRNPLLLKRSIRNPIVRNPLYVSALTHCAQ
jgi:hypothetical protein